MRLPRGSGSTAATDCFLRPSPKIPTFKTALWERAVKVAARSPRRPPPWLSDTAFHIERNCQSRRRIGGGSDPLDPQILQALRMTTSTRSSSATNADPSIRRHASPNVAALLSFRCPVARSACFHCRKCAILPLLGEQVESDDPRLSRAALLLAYATCS